MNRPAPCFVMAGACSAHVFEALGSELRCPDLKRRRGVNLTPADRMKALSDEQTRAVFRDGRCLLRSRLRSFGIRTPLSRSETTARSQSNTRRSNEGSFG